MCPACLVATSLYLAGGASAGAVTTFIATRILRQRVASTASDEPKQRDPQRIRRLK